jgi:cytochrome c2
MSWQHDRRLIIILGAITLIGAGTATAVTLEYRQEQHQLVQRAEALTGGIVARGETAFEAYGCGACHAVRGVPQATGKVGPPLDGVGGRAILAGRLANNPDNMMRWIRDPRGVDPQTAMPPLGLTRAQARDISAFLYTLS